MLKMSADVSPDGSKFHRHQDSNVLKCLKCQQMYLPPALVSNDP